MTNGLPHPAMQPTAPVGKPLFDPANPYAGEGPLEWTTGTVQFPGGQRGVLCMRTLNASTSYPLAKDDLGNLISALQALHASMTGLILPGG